MELFSLECDGHLRAMAACKDGLLSDDMAVSAAAAAGILERLHTLAGAARAVELADLEYLCRVLEALATSATPAWTPARMVLLTEAIALAPQLLAPTPRLRKQMMALASSCADIRP